MIFELHFGSVYVCIYVSIYCLEDFKIFESAGILSLALVNKNWENFLSTYSTREAFFIRSINFESAIITYAFLLDRSFEKSARILSLNLALMNKNWEIFLSTYSTREAFFIRSINFESAGILSLALVNKNWETFLSTYQRSFFIISLLTRLHTKR